MLNFPVLFSQSRQLFLTCLALAGGFLILPDPAKAQNGSNGIQFVNMEVSRVLGFYEAWTGKRVILDGAIQSATITILANGPMSDPEKAEFVEKSLLLNGFALIPAGDRTMKAVVVPGVSGQVRSEGLQVFARPEDLPDGDRIVAYVMRFEHLGAENAAAALGSVFPTHGYGTITPFSQASSVVITDSTSVIRRYLELKPHIDVPQDDVNLSIQEFILERAEASEVAEALSELLNLESNEGGSGSSARTAEGGVTGGGQAAVDLVAALNAGSARTRVKSVSPDTVRIPPKIHADVRTNKIIAVAEAKDMAYIETLIRFLDSPAYRRKLYTRQLHFLQVSTLLENLPNALLLGAETAGGANVAGGSEMDRGSSINNAGSGRSNNRPGGNNGFGGSNFGNSRVGNSGSSLGRGSSGSGGGSSLGSFDSGGDIGPQSMVVGKTFILADNVNNRLLVSGPDEHIALIDDLIDKLDQEPKSIQISAVIAQLTLGENLDFGIDVLREIDDPNAADGFAGSLRNRSDPVLDVSSLLSVEDFTSLPAGLTLYGKIDNFLNTYLSALQATNRFKVLARPTVYTQNNRTALISTGQRIAVPSSTIATVDPGSVNQAITSSISFENVVLEIQVRPLINSEDQITLNINQINDDIVGSQNISGNEIPTIGTQTLATTVVVPNGGTVLLGGLISEDDRNNTSGLPVFVSLPLIGRLFGDHSRQKSRQELLIFIQPKIVDSPVDLANAQADVQARSELAQEAWEFSAPQVKSESSKARFTRLRKFFQPKDNGEPVQAIQNPVYPAPVVQE